MKRLSVLLVVVLLAATALAGTGSAQGRTVQLPYLGFQSFDPHYWTAQLLLA